MPEELNNFLQALESEAYNCSMAINLKNTQDIEAMRVAGRLASEVLDYISDFVKPGVTTGELDRPVPRLHG